MLIYVSYAACLGHLSLCDIVICESEPLTYLGILLDELKLIVKYSGK